MLLGQRRLFDDKKLLSEMIEAYQLHGGKLKEIADEYGCDRSTIRYHLEKVGVYTKHSPTIRIPTPPALRWCCETTRREEHAENCLMREGVKKPKVQPVFEVINPGKYYDEYIQEEERKRAIRFKSFVKMSAGSSYYRTPDPDTPEPPLDDPDDDDIF